MYPRWYTPSMPPYYPDTIGVTYPACLPTTRGVQVLHTQHASLLPGNHAGKRASQPHITRESCREESLPASHTPPGICRVPTLLVYTSLPPPWVYHTHLPLRYPTPGMLAGIKAYRAKAACCRTNS